MNLRASDERSQNEPIRQNPRDGSEGTFTQLEPVQSRDWCEREKQYTTLPPPSVRNSIPLASVKDQPAG